MVDLRGNEGGIPVGDEILAHLIERALPRHAMARRVRFEVVPDELRSSLSTWDPSFFELGKGARAVGDGWFELASPRDGDLAPERPRYRGRLVVIVDESNSSATFEFARRVQTSKLGTLVGTPTGGSVGSTAERSSSRRCRTRRSKSDVPLIGTFPQGSSASAPDTGVMPDVVVRETAADLAAGTDAVLAAALDVAAK